MGPIVFVVVFLGLPLAAALFLAAYVTGTVLWSAFGDVHPILWVLTFTIAIVGGVALGLYRASLRGPPP